MRYLSILILLAGLAACATTPPVKDTVTAMVSEPETPVLITSSSDASPGQLVRFVGVAHDAKLSAIVVSDSFSVYCIELDEWPGQVNGRTVEVTGRLEVTDQYAATVNAKGEISQGTSGGDWLLTGVEWQQVD